MKWCLAVIVLVAVAHGRNKTNCFMFHLYNVSTEIENTPQPCSSYDNCPSCVTFSNDRVSPCGWCAGIFPLHFLMLSTLELIHFTSAENRCVDGTLHGPAVGNCTIWDYGFCSGSINDL